MLGIWVRWVCHKCSKKEIEGDMDMLKREMTHLKRKKTKMKRMVAKSGKELILQSL